MSYLALVINLTDRHDRWKSSVAEAASVGIPIQRVEACTPADVTSDIYTLPNVAACWVSHRRAIQTFLDSHANYALILEDDFQIESRDIIKLIQKSIDTDLDFIQLGFLKTTQKETLNIFIENCYDTLIRIYSVFEHLLLRIGLKHNHKNLTIERKGLPNKYIFADIRPGAHAYLLNRKAASYMITINDPIFLSTDDLYMSIAPMRFIRMARCRRSAIRQTNSVSSINPR